MKDKIRVGFVYNPSNKYFSGKFFDSTNYNLFIRALPRNPDLEITWLKGSHEEQVDFLQYKDKLDAVILFSLNYKENDPNTYCPKIKNLEQINIPKFLFVGDCHASNPQNISKTRELGISCNFFHHSKKYFHKFHPKDFYYEQIFYGFEKDLYKNSVPWDQRRKDSLLLTGSLAAGHAFYDLRIKLSRHKNVTYVGRNDNGPYIADGFPKILQQYQASISATTYMTTTKYIENSAAGCLNFMEVNKNNDVDLLGFKDGIDCIYFTESNCDEKFNEYLKDYKNPKWQEIAKAGKEYAWNNLTNDHSIVAIKEMIQKYL
jgi:hypothetical protein